MACITITAQNFESEVVNSDKPVLLDFWASWCGPCRMLAPVLEEFASEHPEFKICKVNVDEQSDLASKFGIMSIPSLFVIKGGKVVNKSVGGKSKDQLLDMLK